MIEPLADRVLIKQEKQSEMSNGVFIPETARKYEMEAEVISVGPGKFENGTYSPMHVKPGDIVLVQRLSGISVTVDEEEYRIVMESEILAKK